MIAENKDGYVGDYCIYIADYGSNVERVKEIIGQHAFMVSADPLGSYTGKIIAIGQ